MNTIINVALHNEIQDQFLQRLASAGLNEDLAMRVISSRENEIGRRLILLIQGSDSLAGAKRSMEQLTRPFEVASTTACRATDCFADLSIFSYKDPNIEHWLSQVLPASDHFNACVCGLSQSSVTIRDMAAEALGRTEGCMATPVLSLVEGGHTFGVKQVEEIIKRFEGGETGLALADDGHANLFFVHDGNCLVFILDIRKSDRGWFVDVFKWDCEWSWALGSRFVLRV